MRNAMPNFSGQKVLTPGRAARRALLACLLLATGLGGLGAQPPGGAQPAQSPPVRLDLSDETAQGVTVAARDRVLVAVGWTVAQGDREGVHLRVRRDLIWEPATHLGAEAGRQPRDLQLIFDAAGELHALWTALDGDDQRGLYHIRIDSPALPVRPVPRQLTAAGDPSYGDAEFPSAAVLGEDLLIVWQDNQPASFSILSARLTAGGEFLPLGSVSGDSLAGLDPQVLSVEPTPRVAWYEIDESGGQVRVEEWDAADQRWRPSGYERQLAGLPRDQPLLLRDSRLGVVACWQENRETGSAIGLDLPRLVGEEEAVEADRGEALLSEPPGDHGQPDLAGTLPGRLTLAWRVFAEGRQLIRLASLFATGRPPQVITLETGEQRFAAAPAHVTEGNWSAVAWTDDFRDGGAGGVYFSEIDWPAAD